MNMFDMHRHAVENTRHPEKNTRHLRGAWCFYLYLRLRALAS